MNHLWIALCLIGEWQNSIQHLEESISCFQKVMSFDKVARIAKQAQTNLSRSLFSLGVMTGETAILEQASESYRAALKINNRDTNSEKWALLQMDLGLVLVYIGRNIRDITHFKDAKLAFEAALEVITPDLDSVKSATISYELDEVNEMFNNQ